MYMTMAVSPLGPALSSITLENDKYKQERIKLLYDALNSSILNALLKDVKVNSAHLDL